MFNHYCSRVVRVGVFIGVAVVAAIASGQEANVNQSNPAPAATQALKPESNHINSGSSRALDAQLPDSPGAVYAQNLVQDQTSPSQTSSQPTQATTPPVGTAAARTANPAGIAASQPAGAAIAPAKQRRVRTLLISLGAVLGAGAALGAVAALSSASPSRPPGAH